MASGWIDRTTLPPLPDVADALGLQRKRGRPPSLSPCPQCGAERRGKRDPRGPIGLRHDRKGWQCHRCQAKGDALSLVKAMVGDWPEVKAFCLDQGWVSDGLLSSPRRQRWMKPRAAPKSKTGVNTVEALNRPPIATLKALLKACPTLSTILDEGEAAPRASRSFLEGRGMCPRRLAQLQVCSLLPEDHDWPEWWPAHWSPWEIVVPAYEVDGSLGSMHGRAVSPSETPKTRWPRGYHSKGLIFADVCALAILRGLPAGGLQGVLICEGITDYMAACLSVDREGLPLAVVGGTSGSWEALGGVPWPGGLRLYLAMDGDQAGDAYCDTLTRSLGSRLGWRVPIPSGLDLSDIHKKGHGLGELLEKAEVWSPHTLQKRRKPNKNGPTLGRGKAQKTHTLTYTYTKESIA